METWKIIEGFENYSVSDHGNVRNNKTRRIMKKCVFTDGYVVVRLSTENKVSCLKKVSILVAQAFLHNVENKPCVDHVDNNRTNNNILNLRWATSQENNRNASMRKDNTSGVKGVAWHKASQKWQSQIKIDGIQIHLGTFKNLEDAKQARITKANQVFGVFTNSCEKII